MTLLRRGPPSHPSPQRVSPGLALCRARAPRERSDTPCRLPLRHNVPRRYSDHSPLWLLEIPILAKSLYSQADLAVGLEPGCARRADRDHVVGYLARAKSEPHCLLAERRDARHPLGRVDELQELPADERLDVVLGVHLKRLSDLHPLAVSLAGNVTIPTGGLLLHRFTLTCEGI